MHATFSESNVKLNVNQLFGDAHSYNWSWTQKNTKEDHWLHAEIISFNRQWEMFWQFKTL